MLSQLAGDQGAPGRQECQIGACSISFLLSRRMECPCCSQTLPTVAGRGRRSGASGAHGTEGWARGEEGTWGGRASNRRRGGGRWAGAPKTRALRPPAEAPHSRVGHRGHRSACEGLAAGSGGAAAPAQQSRAERSRASAQPGRRRLPHAIAATKSSLNPGGRSSRGCAAQEALSCGSGGRDQTEDGPEEKTP